jgi:hypothetical protein
MYAALSPVLIWATNLPYYHDEEEATMGRQVITSQDVQDAITAKAASGALAAGSPAPAPPPDEYSDRLIKYIPGEIVSVYLFVNGVLVTAGGQIPPKTMSWLRWLVFAFLFVLTPVYLSRVQDVKKKQQWAIVMISFVIWVFTLGGPFAQFSWYHPVYGAVLLPLYTFLIAIVEAKK